jgi:mRNA interferase RelE/StbE
MYEIIILPAAEKEIQKLPFDVADAILDALEQLASNPRITGSKQMNNYSTPRLKMRTFHRIKVKKDYRVIYHIQDQQCIITVVKAAHRKESYKK